MTPRLPKDASKELLNSMDKITEENNDMDSENVREYLTV